METDFHSANLKPQDRLALQFVQQVSRSNPRPLAMVPQLREAGCSQEMIAELICHAADAVLGNRVATLLAVPPNTELEGLAGSRWRRVFHPWMARAMRKGFGRKSQVTPLTDAEVTGPFSLVLSAIRDAPQARSLMEAARDAMQSTLLPMHIKVLMVAVVARALECAICEQGARTMAQACSLDEKLLEEAVATLGSTQLKPEEELLLKFARATVRYRPAEAQRLTRQLLTSYSTDQVVEAVGIAALANAYARMTVAVALL